jgi:hypothetical protein
MTSLKHVANISGRTAVEAACHRSARAGHNPFEFRQRRS